ncbi:MAG: MaoC family dehydratase [Dehalococcoidia bacterium]|nr:MaoC family dehydratase [Dehalococcoidia bacterium]
MTRFKQGLEPPELREGTAIPPVVKSINQKMIALYAEASGDFNPIHIDETFAKSTPLGGTIAHGMLILSYISEMMAAAFGRAWLTTGGLSVRFKAPARPGDTITTTGKIKSIERQDGVTHIRCSVESCNQAKEVVISGITTVTTINHGALSE